MAIKLVANYSKRLGLPGYSSHQFSVSVETELRDLAEADTEMSNLYHQLQRNVDVQIQQTGFVPSEAYGSQPSPQQLPSSKPQPSLHLQPGAPAAFPSDHEAWFPAKSTRTNVLTTSALPNLHSPLNDRSDLLFPDPDGSADEDLLDQTLGNQAIQGSDRNGESRCRLLFGDERVAVDLRAKRRCPDGS